MHPMNLIQNVFFSEFQRCSLYVKSSTGELGYDGLNGTRKIGPSYAKSVVYI